MFTLKRWKICHLNRQIKRLQQEYAYHIGKPYSAARLSEIISELSRLWNDKLRYEEDHSAEPNGLKSLGEVQKSVLEIVCEAETKIGKASGRKEKHKAFIEGLVKIRDTMDEWEPTL